MLYHVCKKWGNVYHFIFIPRKKNKLIFKKQKKVKNLLREEKSIE